LITGVCFAFEGAYLWLGLDDRIGESDELLKELGHDGSIRSLDAIESPPTIGCPDEQVRGVFMEQYRGEPIPNPTDRCRDVVPSRGPNPFNVQSSTLEQKSRKLVISEGFQLNEYVVRSIHLSPARLMWQAIIARMVLDVTMVILVIHDLQPAVVTGVVRMVVVDQIRP
jgi:hypothetical protein